MYSNFQKWLSTAALVLGLGDSLYAPQCAFRPCYQLLRCSCSILNHPAVTAGIVLQIFLTDTTRQQLLSAIFLLKIVTYRAAVFVHPHQHVSLDQDCTSNNLLIIPTLLLLPTLWTSVRAHELNSFQMKLNWLCAPTMHLLRLNGK